MVQDPYIQGSFTSTTTIQCREKNVAIDKYATFSTPLQFLLAWTEVWEKLHPNKKKKTYVVNIIKVHSVNVVVYKI
jgi:hypothetical protein